MGEAPDIHHLARQVAIPEERMKTMQAEYETGLERIAGENKAALERLERRIAERDKDNTRWQIGLWLAAIVVLGFLIRWPF